jgi:hypothetical protein
MTKDKLESNPNVSPLAKLIARYLYEHPAASMPAAAVGQALATRDGDVIEAGFELRRLGILAGRVGDVSIPAAQFVMTEAARKAYAPAAQKAGK